MNERYEPEAVRAWQQYLYTLLPNALLVIEDSVGSLIAPLMQAPLLCSYAPEIQT